MAKRFKDLTEREILALAIALEEEDSRIYGDFAEGLRESYPATAKIFEEMQAEESRPSRRPSSICTASGSANISRSSAGRTSRASSSASRCGWCGRWELTPSASRPR